MTVNRLLMRQQSAVSFITHSRGYVAMLRLILEISDRNCNAWAFPPFLSPMCLEQNLIRLNSANTITTHKPCQKYSTFLLVFSRERQLIWKLLPCVASINAARVLADPKGSNRRTLIRPRVGKCDSVRANFPTKISLRPSRSRATEEKILLAEITFNLVLP